MAKDFGYNKGYHEEKIIDFLIEDFSVLGDPVDVLTNGALYHMAHGVLTSDSIRRRAWTHRSFSHFAQRRDH